MTTTSIPVALQDSGRIGSKLFPPYFERLFQGNDCASDIHIIPTSNLVSEQGYHVINLGTPYRLSRATAEKKGGGIVVYDGVNWDAWRKAERRGSKLLFDMMIEAVIPTDTVVEALVEGCREFDVDPASLVIMNSNRRAAATMDGLIRKAHPNFSGATFLDVNACFWLIKGHNLLTNDSEGRLQARLRNAEAARTKVRERKFVSFNGRLRRHRLFIVAWMMAQGYIQDGFVSLLGYSVGELPSAAKLIGDVARYHDAEIVTPVIPRLLQNLPMKVDVGLDESQTDSAYIKILPWISPNADPYDNSYFSVVIDTSFDDADVLFLTPIAFKSFMNLSPFVYFGNQGALAELRHLGFQTFSPFIDESYDGIANNADRLKSALAVLDHLNSLTKSELAMLHSALWDRLEHNFWHLHRLDQNGFRADVSERLQRILQTS